MAEVTRDGLRFERRRRLCSSIEPLRQRRFATASAALSNEKRALAAPRSSTRLPRARICSWNSIFDSDTSFASANLASTTSLHARLWWALAHITEFELVLCGHFDVFTIQFNASGFHRLFGAPMTELADRAYDARSVIGPCLSEIEQKLSDAASFEARVEIANDFLLRRPEADVVDFVAVVANRLFRDPTGFRVSDAARSAGLSVRQFERRFAGQVGLPPKQYASIIRFDAALRAKTIAPQRLWTEIAHEFGYYDQMHMIRDFERFAGDSPAALVRRIAGSSQSWM